MRMIYSNKLDTLSPSVITASSAIAGYPITNVQDQKLTTKWFSDSTTTQTVVFDFTTATVVTVIGVLGHNIASTATVVINANATNVWTAPSVTQSLTWDSGIILKFISSQSYRYWQFSFSGLTTGLEIGRLWLGEYISASPSSTQDFNVTKKRSDVVSHGRGRQKYASVGLTWRRIELSFPETSSTSLSNILTMIDTVGNHSSLIFCNFDDLTTYELVKPMYCSIDGEVKFSHTTRQQYKWPLALEEEL